MIAILHDLNLAIAYADKIIFMKNGVVENIYDSPEKINKEVLVKNVFDIDMEKIANPYSGKPYFVVKN